jgi:hypothetical protein
LYKLPKLCHKAAVSTAALQQPFRNNQPSSCRRPTASIVCWRPAADQPRELFALFAAVLTLLLLLLQLTVA